MKVPPIHRNRVRGYDAEKGTSIDARASMDVHVRTSCTGNIDAHAKAGECLMRRLGGGRPSGSVVSRGEKITQEVTGADGRMAGSPVTTNQNVDGYRLLYRTGSDEAACSGFLRRLP